MFNSDPTDSGLLRSILEPLLEDFQYWFQRSRLLLEKEPISFLSADKRADLLARVEAAQKEVSTAQLLFKTMNGQVGIETSVMKPWHDLVAECWQVAVRFRMQESSQKNVNGIGVEHTEN